MSDAEDREQEHAEGLHEDTRHGDCPVCEDAYRHDVRNTPEYVPATGETLGASGTPIYGPELPEISGPYCYCGHTLGSHLDEHGADKGYCDGCADAAPDDDLDPSHDYIEVPR